MEYSYTDVILFSKMLQHECLRVRLDLTLVISWSISRRSKDDADFILSSIAQSSMIFWTNASNVVRFLPTLSLWRLSFSFGGPMRIFHQLWKMSSIMVTLHSAFFRRLSKCLKSKMNSSGISFRICFISVLSENY